MRGLTPLDSSTRALLHQMHWRKPPRDRRRLWTGLAITLLLHVLFGGIAWHEMQPRPLPPELVQVQLDHVLRVRLIAHPIAAVPAPPPLAVPPPHAPPPPPPRAVREPVAKNAMTVSLPSPPPALHLYDRSGQIALPANAASAPTAPSEGYVAHLPQSDAQVMQGQAGKQYQAKSNQFTPYFPPPGETAAGTLMRRITGSKSVDLPGGVHLKCKTVLGIPTPECHDPPPPPPSNDGDERLSMAAAPLAKDPQAAKPPSVAQCIALYRAGKPLPYGCPVDTPSRAVDAEKHAVAAPANGH
jgi:hypothetical protein